MPPLQKYTSALETRLLSRNEPFASKRTFPWNWNEPLLNETPCRNKDLRFQPPLPLPVTHHPLPTIRKKKPSGAILKSEKTLGTSHQIEILLPAGSLVPFPAIILMMGNFVSPVVKISTKHFSLRDCQCRIVAINCNNVSVFFFFLLDYNVYFRWLCCLRTWTYNNKAFVKLQIYG